MATYTFNVKKIDGTVVPVIINADNYKQARIELREQQKPEAQKVQKGQF